MCGWNAGLGQRCVDMNAQGGAFGSCGPQSGASIAAPGCGWNPVYALRVLLKACMVCVLLRCKVGTAAEAVLLLAWHQQGRVLQALASIDSSV